MNWDAVGAIAELVGALAVVATLAYLAVQIRQNTMSARVAARLEMTRQFSDYVDGLINNPEANSVFTRGGAGDHLDENDAVLFSRLMHKCFWYLSAMHFQYIAHSLGEDEWHQSKGAMLRIVRTPGVVAWWHANKHAYSPSFVAFVDSEILPDMPG
jgi:hypothetical protein